MDWMHEVIESIATQTKLRAESLSVPPSEVTGLLDVARIAAHVSGDRTNAPILCYVLGLAVARGARFEDVVSIVGKLEESAS